jgi:glycosyltransferase involved in cell wall biosynthesis
VVEAKGVLVLLEAVRQLAARGAPVEVAIMGNGEALARCHEMASVLGGPTRLEVIASRPYGPSFLEVLREYHGVVVPSLQDEQPRVIYDAYSQALPVLASATDGNRSCVQEGRTGLLIPAGDPVALTGGILRLLEEPGLARGLGMAAIRLARQETHLAMHLRRARVLHGLLNAGRPLEEIVADQA